MTTPHRDQEGALTEEEVRVLRLAGSERTSSEIAVELGLTIEQTVALFEQVLWKLQLRAPRAESVTASACQLN